MLFGIDPRVILGLAGTVETVQNMGASQQQVQGKAGPPSDEMGRFVAGVLADTEKTWGTLFQQLGRQYRDPALVLFTGATPTACGTGQTAMGPFYCPLDQKRLHRPAVLPGSCGTSFARRVTLPRRT